MPEYQESKRKYDSSRRKKQARETQRQILAAARELFITYGFAGTTIESIAQKANVAVETIYSAFGNKLNILARVVGISITGDDEPVPLLERVQIKAVEAEDDPKLQIQMFSRQLTEIMERVAPLFHVMRAVSKTETEIAYALKELLNGRLNGMGHFVRILANQKSLRPGLDEQTMIETVWALTSAEIYSLLTLDRNWSREQYEHWLAETLIRYLLP